MLHKGDSSRRAGGAESVTFVSKYLHLQELLFFFFLLVKFVAGSRGSGCTSYDLHEEGDLPR